MQRILEQGILMHRILMHWILNKIEIKTEEDLK